MLANKSERMSKGKKARKDGDWDAKKGRQFWPMRENRQCHKFEIKWDEIERERESPICYASCEI